MAETKGQLSFFSSEVRPEGHPKEEAERTLNVIRQEFRDKQMRQVHAHNQARRTKHMIEQEPAPDAVHTRAQMMGVHSRISTVFHDRRGRGMT
jgi:hypothetical protein